MASGRREKLVYDTEPGLIVILKQRKDLQGFASFSALRISTSAENIAVAGSDSHFFQSGLLALFVPMRSTILVPGLQFS